ncbi:glycosyltransferase family 2 protein [Oryzobacter telluris]|uniref:glycosyltransferase family 2 protein n=1 Tax=Oryzobacter telluris TaxID=3149179 RepID=UPI00370D3813
MAAGRAATTTIALPVFNGERFLGDAIDSVLGQTLAPTEFLVFDNASTDLSRLLATQRLGEDAVRVAPRNAGASWNFTRAVEESTGEYFAWLAADDRFHPRFLERTTAALDSSPSAAACLCTVEFIDLEGRTVGLQRDPELADVRPSVRLRSFLRRHRWTESYCLYRREVLLASPMFRGEFAADVILTWWFLLRGPLVVVDEPLLQYRVYPTKTDEEMADSLTPGARPVSWRKLRLWRALWRETSGPDVDWMTRRTARGELLLALTSRAWLDHNLKDLKHVLHHRPRPLRKGAPTS